MFCNPLNSLKINTEKISNDTNFIFPLIPSVLITFIVNLSCQINFTRTTKSNNTYRVLNIMHRIFRKLPIRQ